jgi:hypothetical protein
MVTAKLSIQLSSALTLILMLQACTSSVLSKRTDDQAWIEYQKEMNLKRVPASVDSDESVKQLHTRLNEVPLRKILLSCSPTEGTRACYQQKLVLAFDEAFRQSQGKAHALSDVIYKNEQQVFLKSRAYDTVSSEVHQFHQLLLSGMDLRAVDHVRDLNHECESASDAPVQTYQPFSGGSFEIPKGYFACLNAGWDKDAGQLLDETSERLGLVITTPEAKEWIKQRQIYPVYDEVTRSILTKKTAENQESWNASLEEQIAKMDFSQSLTAFVKKEAEGLRSRYPYLAIEAALTDLYQKHQKDFKGAPSP